MLPTRGDGYPWLLGFGLTFVAFLPLGEDAVAVFRCPVEVILISWRWNAGMWLIDLRRT